jgi:mRNA interferase MazF
MAARGDIALARFPFTDQTQARLRPVLILAEVPGRYRDFIVMFISSQLNQAVPQLDFVLNPSDPTFAASGLKVPSVFRIAKIAALSDALMVGTLGRMDATTFDEILRRLVGLLQTGRPSPTAEG